MTIDFTHLICEKQRNVLLNKLVSFRIFMRMMLGFVSPLLSFTELSRLKKESYLSKKEMKTYFLSKVFLSFFLLYVNIVTLKVIQFGLCPITILDYARETAGLV